MNSSQKTTMDLLAQMGKPDVHEATIARDLAKSLSLPGRVVAALDDYIEAAQEAAELVRVAKEATDRQSECWRAVREHASKSAPDIVDLAEQLAGCQAPEAGTVSDVSSPLTTHEAVNLAENVLAQAAAQMNEQFARSGEDVTVTFIPGPVESAAQTPAPTDPLKPLRGVDLARQEGREAWTVNGVSRPNPYVKRSYVQAFDAGVQEALSAYNKGVTDRQSSTERSALAISNPYAGTDISGALARAYTLGLGVALPGAFE